MSSPQDGYQNTKRERVIAVTVASGASLSPAFYIGDGYLFASIQTPGTAQIDELRFEQSLDSTDGSDGTFSPLLDSTGTAIALTASTSDNISCSDAAGKAFSIAGWLKLRTRASSSNQNQSQNTTFYILVRR